MVYYSERVFTVLLNALNTNALVVELFFGPALIAAFTLLLGHYCPSNGLELSTGPDVPLDTVSALEGRFCASEACSRYPHTSRVALHLAHTGSSDCASN